MRTKTKERRMMFNSLKDEIEQVYKEQTESLYKLFPEFKPSQSSNGLNGERGEKVRLVKLYLDSHSDPFKAKDITAWIKAQYPDAEVNGRIASSISNALSRLKGKLVERVTDKLGSGSAVYKKKNDPLPF